MVSGSLRRLALTALLVGCGAKPSPAKVRPAPLVSVLEVRGVDVPVVVRAPVDVRPVVQVEVGSKTVGYLDAVLVERGDVVRKGQLLALVRPAELSDQLSAAKSAVSQAQAGAALAHLNLERATELAPRGLVSQQELQSTTTSAAAADAQLVSAQAQLGMMATRLGETRLEAPFDGVVIARSLDPGALVGGGANTVLTVARIDVVRVFVAVNERNAGAVKVGQVVRLTFDALEAQRFEGKVDRLAPAFDPLTRTLQAEVQLSNPERLLRPGMYGRAELELARHPGAVVVPVGAVQLWNGRAFLYVLDGEIAHRVPVTLGEDLGDDVEVTSGVAVGAVVITRGTDVLSHGMKVRTAGSADAGR